MDMQQIGQELRLRLDDFSFHSQIRNIGTVLNSGDGIVRCTGLSQVQYGALLSFDDNIFGMAQNLDVDEVGVVLLNSSSGVAPGSRVVSTGLIVEVPTGDALLGRVVNPLGIPVDNRGRLQNVQYRPIESPAPGIIDRQPVDRPLQTGLIAIDSMIPIGRGQRELIIGDRQTGKTAIAVDTVLNQKGKGMICVYVAIGQKASTVASITNIFEKSGAMEYTVVVSSTASDPAPMQYIAPYAGCSIAEGFMYAGKDVLVIYDDLSKHAVAYRAMSLLLRRPPGREAYPGDVFYLHSRLLERAARLSEDKGGGSMTALPIVETMEGDISAYIPTNVISITDGQIFLESELFFAGVRPAVNVGLSVSRVGGSAQIPAMRAISGPLRLDLAQYRELAVFTQFGADLDRTTQEMLRHGERLTETLKQEQYKPLPVAEQVALLYVVTHNLTDTVSIKLLHEFQQGFLQYLRQSGSDTLERIELSHKWNDALGEEVKALLNQYLDIWNLQHPQENEELEEPLMQ